MVYSIFFKCITAGWKTETETAKMFKKSRGWESEKRQRSAFRGCGRPLKGLGRLFKVAQQWQPLPLPPIPASGSCHHPPWKLFTFWGKNMHMNVYNVCGWKAMECECVCGFGLKVFHTDTPPNRPPPVPSPPLTWRQTVYVCMSLSL